MTLKKVTYAEALEEVLGVGINVELAGLGLGDIQGGDLRNVLVLTLTLLLLKLEGDTANRTTLDTLHKVGGVTSDLKKRLVYQYSRSSGGSIQFDRVDSNLVAKTLGGNDGDLIADTLVGVKVERQPGVVTLDDDLSGLLDGLFANPIVRISFLQEFTSSGLQSRVDSAHLSPDATHFGGCLLDGCSKDYPRVVIVLAVKDPALAYPTGVRSLP